MTHFIKLTKGYNALVDECDKDLGCMKWWAAVTKWGTYACRDMPMVKGVRGKKMYMHRAVAERMGLDVSNPELVVDHINGNSLDNRRENLRLLTTVQNARNLGPSRSNNTSGHLGVAWDRARCQWKAYIRHNGKMLNIGRYASQEEALAARLDAENRLWDITPRRSA